MEKQNTVSDRTVVTPCEDPIEYETLVENLHRDLKPRTTIEELLIQQIASSQWRHKRLMKFEHGRIQSNVLENLSTFETKDLERERNLTILLREETDKEYKQYLATSTKEKRWREGLSPDEKANVETWARFDTDSIHSNMRMLENELRTLKESREQRKRCYMEIQLAPFLGAQLIRYESNLGRQFYRALFTLLKIQASREKRDQKTLSGKNGE